MKRIVRVMMCATLLLLASAVVGTAAGPQEFGTPRPMPLTKGIQPQIVPLTRPPPTPPADLPPGSAGRLTLGKAANPPCKTGARVWDGDLGYEVVKVGPILFVNATYLYEQVFCPIGKKVVGGGVEIDSNNPAGGSRGSATLVESAPRLLNFKDSYWWVSAYNESSFPMKATVSAICICAN